MFTKEIEESMSATVVGSIELVWKILTDTKEVSWRSDLTRCDVKDEAHWTEFGNGKTPTEVSVLQKQAPTFYVLTLANYNLASTRSFELSKIDENTTLLKISEFAEVKNQVMAPVAQTFMKQMQKRLLDDLMTETVKRGGL
jgi:hypothetical protein